MCSELYAHFSELGVSEFQSGYIRHDIAISITPFILKYLQSLLSSRLHHDQDEMHVVFVCLDQTQSFYKSLLSKLGMTSVEGAVSFCDVLTSPVESLQELEQRLSSLLTRNSLLVFDNFASLFFFTSSIKELLKLYLTLSNNYRYLIASPRELPFPEVISFHNFIISRSDCVIELTPIKGSTAAVGVDGRYDVMGYKMTSSSDSGDDVMEKNVVNPVRKTLLFKVVDRSVLLYPMGSV